MNTGTKSINVDDDADFRRKSISRCTVYFPFRNERSDLLEI
jgi:hypothetical protein